MLIKREPSPPPENHYLLPVGHRHFAFVDFFDFAWASHYYWRLLKSSHVVYVARREIRNGRTCTIRLHCEIMHTPPGYECHHKNHNPLDNRKSNLENLTPSEHRAAHMKS